MALVQSSKPAKFDSLRVQPGYVAIHPQSVRNRVRQTTTAWHRIFIRINHVTPIGGIRRTSRRTKQHWLHRIWNIFCVQLDGSAQFTDGRLLATCMLLCCGSQKCSRLPLTEQQATTKQLQLKWCKWIALDLLATMQPFFPTCVTYMHSMFSRGKRILIQVI